MRKCYHTNPLALLSQSRYVYTSDDSWSVMSSLLYPFLPQKTSGVRITVSVHSLLFSEETVEALLLVPCPTAALYWSAMYQQAASPAQRASASERTSGTSAKQFGKLWDPMNWNSHTALLQDRNKARGPSHVVHKNTWLLTVYPLIFFPT